MFADECKHEVGTYLTKQAKLLLGHQAAINASTYEKKTGSPVHLPRLLQEADSM